MEENQIWYDEPTEESKKDYKAIRKNFLVVSFIIIVYQLGEVDIEKLSLLGTSIEFKNPTIVPYVMYTIFGYYVLRYFQHSMKVGRQVYAEALDLYLDQELAHEIETIFHNELTETRKSNSGVLMEDYKLPVYSDFKYMDRAFVSTQWRIITRRVKPYYEDIELDLNLPHLRIRAMVHKVKFWFLFPDRLDFILPYVVAVFAVASYWICF